LRIRTEIEGIPICVSSFANASGGYMIIGIEAEGGAPTRLVGLDEPNIDAAKKLVILVYLNGDSFLIEMQIFAWLHKKAGIPYRSRSFDDFTQKM
jgi:predicted HTH transcriptional regulator